MTIEALRRAARLGALSVLVLTIATALGLAVARLLMPITAGELVDLALYMFGVGATTMAVAAVALLVADRVRGVPFTAKALIASATGSLVALANVLIVAKLMFVNTGHDLRLLIALIVASGVVTVFFSIRVAALATRQARAVAGAVSSLSRGEYRALPAGGSGEFADLARAVNRLGERLEEADRQRDLVERQRRELTAAISHDLRTPLGSIRAIVEALDDGLVTDRDEVARYHATIRREVERLNRMIDDLFELARMDAGVLELDRRMIALQDVASEVVDAMTPLALRSGVTLSLQVEGSPPPLSIDGARMERVITNIVQNAIEHTPEQGSVDVRVAVPSTDAVTLQVADTGCGIAERDLPHIWDRFYRGERSRHRSDLGGAGGAGIGLAIVQSVVESHGGSVDARSAPGEGTVMTVRLPAAVRA